MARSRKAKTTAAAISERLFYVLRANHQSKPLRLYTYLANHEDWISATQLLPETIRARSLYQPFDSDVLLAIQAYDDALLWQRAMDRFHLPTQAAPILLARIAAAGRLLGTVSDELMLRPEDCRQLSWDDGPEWTCELRLGPWDAPADEATDADYVVARLAVRNQDVRVAGTDVAAIYRENVIWVGDRVGSIADGHEMWVSMLREPVVVESDELDEFIGRLFALPELPHFEIDPLLGIKTGERRPAGKVRIEFRKTGEPPYGTVSFVYGDREIRYDDTLSERPIWDAAQREVFVRQPADEARLRDELQQLGLLLSPMGWFPIEFDQFTDTVRRLNKAGWLVYSHGERVRTPSQSPSLTVSSGIDWFELEATVDFGDGHAAAIPKLLESVRDRVDFVRLDDGSLGMLPENFLARFVAAIQLASVAGEKLRFGRNQAWLLDALLLERQYVTTDDRFESAVQQLATFQGVEPRREPAEFQGELRSYQRDGLGWLAFLREFGFGGCLADDMGLGKTIQVLAMLQACRQAAGSEQMARTSIAVVPASLVFNWIDEAQKFTPDLKVVNYTGPQRKKLLANIDGVDLLVTTYGTLRRDILTIKDYRFEYAILDEAQAIKNPEAQATKAMRLLRANHRLAMTGTPVENRLTDLWSIFEFLNPGMFGTAAKFSKLVSTAAATAPRVVAGEQDTDANVPSLAVENPTLETVRRAIQPFLLRRTKQQVLTELPDKNEQTLYCTMTPAQARGYRELRDHYRATLQGRVDEFGIGKAKIHVLEALLRLRQAACDPRLLDPSQTRGGKVELLVEQLDEVLAGGHKALVFSQFTTLLSLVRGELDQRGWVYEYLDGKTRNRKARIDRFQQDGDCPLFLISLKAGGHGLNLTAADYVFILDPWWNPAAEAQAIDRAHRIGQTKAVMAYRLICEGTVEEKILKLQHAKRSMADAIVSANESLLKQITLEDIQLLLS